MLCSVSAFHIFHVAHLLKHKGLFYKSLAYHTTVAFLLC